MSARFEFRGLVAGYGGTTILRGIAGAVAAGEVLFVLGRNGVGKSTLMKALMGFLPCREGAVRLDGREIGGLAPPERRRAGITYCPQERAVFDELSVADNLFLTAPPGAAARLAPLAERFPILARRREQRAGTLSGGEKKILSFVRGAIEDHSLVLLDEPTEGVQAENIERMEAVVREQCAAGTAFVVVEQNLAMAERLADRWLVLDKGQVVAEGSGRPERAAIIAHIQV
ncbi:MAG: ATP-binding cassette domain-containing protein [Candidatus Odyssella sp.]|nr:ATP-binding cassette domain-containing protein [Candidatus Odyssella sp.]